MPFRTTYDLSEIKSLMNNSCWSTPNGRKFMLSCMDAFCKHTGSNSSKNVGLKAKAINNYLKIHTNIRCIPLFSRDKKQNDTNQPTVLNSIDMKTFSLISPLFETFYNIVPEHGNCARSLVILLYEVDIMDPNEEFDLEFAVNTINKDIKDYYKNAVSMPESFNNMVIDIWEKDGGWHWITPSELNRREYRSKYTKEHNLKSLNKSQGQATRTRTSRTDIKTRIDKWFEVGYNLGKEVSDYSKLELASDVCTRLIDLAKLIEKETDLSWERVRNKMFIKS